MSIKPNLSQASAVSNSNLAFLLNNPTYVPASPDEGGWNLSQLLAVLRRRALLMTGVAIATTSVVWVGALLQKPQYLSGFQLLVEPVTEDGRSLSALDNNASKSNKPVLGSKLDYLTEIKVLGSPNLLQPIVEDIQKQYPEVTYRSLMSSITIDQQPGTKILEIKYQDTNADKVEFILNKLALGYLKYGQQMRQVNVRRGIDFVNGQIAKTQKRVDSLQLQMQQFRQRNDFIDPQVKAEKVATQLSALEQQSIETQKLLAEAQKMYANVGERSGAMAALASSLTYQKLREQIREVESKIAIERSRFNPTMPQVLMLEDQRNNLLPLLRQEARQVLGNKLAEGENQLAILEVRQQSIANAQRYWQQQSQLLPATARQYTDLQRDLGVATDSLNRFLQIRESLQVEAAQKEIPWQIIQPPERPRVPIDSISRSLLLGGITGLLLSIAAAFVAERLDNTFHSSNDLKKQVKLPLLGVIPFQPALQSYIVTTVLGQSLSPGSRKLFGHGESPQEYATSTFLEAFRSLYANLGRLNSEFTLPSVVISSPVSGDGKSTIAMFLAQAASAMGKRVLLIDADLRSPQISNMLGFGETGGLTTLLETDLHPNQVIQTLSCTTANSSYAQVSSAVGGLSVLPSGPVPVDPSRLLSSHKMQELAKYFESVFDLIVYDVPPLLSVVDSNLLAAHTNGVILVAGLEQTDRAALMDAIDGLNLAHIPILGIVANCARRQTFTSMKRYGSHLTQTAK